jgi:hypothetical protein
MKQVTLKKRVIPAKAGISDRKTVTFVVVSHENTYNRPRSRSEIPAFAGMTCFVSVASFTDAFRPCFLSVASFTNTFRPCFLSVASFTNAFRGFLLGKCRFAACLCWRLAISISQLIIFAPYFNEAYVETSNKKTE